MNQRDQYPWSFGSAIEALCRAAIRERYTLMPYLYSAFLCASETGAPIQRPLIFDHQNDTHARGIDDEFLLGEHILVAPITDPGRCERQVYLPGGEWQSWHDGSPREGGRFHREAAPLERIPVFVRAGAVIPLWPEVPASTDAYHPEDIVLLIAVPSRDGETASILHEDDGLSTDHAQGAFVRTHFTLRLENGTLRLSASVEGQGYPAFRRQRFRIRPLAASIAADDILIDAGKNPFSVNLPWVAS
jgi:alpha-glucosidase